MKKGIYPFIAVMAPNLENPGLAQHMLDLAHHIKQQDHIHINGQKLADLVLEANMKGVGEDEMKVAHLLGELWEQDDEYVDVIATYSAGLAEKPDDSARLHQDAESERIGKWPHANIGELRAKIFEAIKNNDFAPQGWHGTSKELVAEQYNFAQIIENIVNEHLRLERLAGCPRR